MIKVARSSMVGRMNQIPGLMLRDVMGIPDVVRPAWSGRARSTCSCERRLIWSLFQDGLDLLGRRIHRLLDGADFEQGLLKVVVVDLPDLSPLRDGRLWAGVLEHFLVRI